MADNIYDYIKENFNIEVKDYTFKRDYIKNPLIKGTGSINRGEKPYKEDLEYLYIILNIRRNDLCKLFNMYDIKPWLSFFNIKKSVYDRLKNSKETNKLKYGAEYFCQTDDYIKKVKETNLKNFGVEYPMKSITIRNKSKETNLKNLGVEYPAQSKICLKRRDTTNIKKYGYTCPLLNEKVKLKSYQTMIQKYDYIYPIQNEKLKEIILNKSYNTKLKNKSFNKSKDEEEIFNLLKEKYPNTLRQYKSELYPWNCDFYIPEIDTYIEYQGHWTHGKGLCHCPYDYNNKEHIQLVKLWEEKKFIKPLYVWTILDPLKRKTAKENNLNWLEFFTVDDFIKWFNCQ